MKPTSSAGESPRVSFQLLLKLRIRHQEPLPVGEGVEVSKVGHGRSVAATTVEDQHQRRPAFRKRHGKVQVIGAVYATNVEMFLLIFRRRSSSAAPCLRKSAAEQDNR
jgi:hypothetical protein